jgi:hypothetical protein
MKSVLLPFDRARLRERNKLDAEEEIVEAQALAPAQRVAEVLEMGDLLLDLADATGASRHSERADPLSEKARLYAEPLRRLAAR